MVAFKGGNQAHVDMETFKGVNQTHVHVETFKGVNQSHNDIGCIQGSKSKGKQKWQIFVSCPNITASMRFNFVICNNVVPSRPFVLSDSISLGHETLTENMKQRFL